MKKSNNDGFTLIYSEARKGKSKEKYREAFNRVSFYKDLLAHDINNILQNINSSCELISIFSEDPLKSEKINDLNEIIKEQVIRGRKLIHNVRKLSKLEKAEFDLIKIDIHEVLKDAIEYILNRFQGREILFKVEISDKEHNIFANEFLIDVLENILLNAVIHNINQIVKILIKISKDVSNGVNYVKIEFNDNGIGIPDKKKKRIFKSDERIFNDGKGMGLGLSLVKKIVDSYKGKIWVKNRIKRDYSMGSNFVLLIPEAT